MRRVRSTRSARTLVLLAVLGCAAVPVPRRAPYHPSDADVGVTRIVHGSVIVEMRGARLLVDPWFNSGLLRRQREPLGLTPDALPGVAALLITHTHGDHYDPDTLRGLAPSVPVAIARPELVRELAALGFARVVALDWWDHTTVGDVTVTAVPANDSVPQNGYVFEAPGGTVYVAGDTRPFDALVDVATRFPSLTVALLPVGGERFLGMKREMTPEDAAGAAAVLKAERVIPTEYGEHGGLPLRWHARRPVERFIDGCEKRGIARDRIVVLAPGESWHHYD
jgi:L-ascorbate metabolism protein UlaG (beta-lactamase superfamily)